MKKQLIGRASHFSPMAGTAWEGSERTREDAEEQRVLFAALDSF